MPKKEELGAYLPTSIFSAHKVIGASSIERARKFKAKASEPRPSAALPQLAIDFFDP